jgi:hypothetical protein
MIKKMVKQALFVLVLMNLALTVQMFAANAETPKSDDFYGPLRQIYKVGQGTNLPDFTTTGQHPDAPPDYLQEGVGAATSPIYFALDFFRYVVSGVAVVIVVIQAIKLVSTANEEEAGKAKTTLIAGTIGLLVIQVADVAVKKIFFGEQGEAFEDAATVEIYAEEGVAVFRGIIGLVEIFVGAASMLVIILRGFLLITSTGDEEATSKAKKHIIYAIVGLATVLLSEVVVRGVVFPKDGEALPDVQMGKFIIIQLTNYLSGFIAIFAFAILFYGGYQYVVGGGNEETTGKVKKLILGAIIGLIIAMGAFAIVNTVLQIEAPEEQKENVAQN